MICKGSSQEVVFRNEWNHVIWNFFAQMTFVERIIHHKLLKIIKVVLFNWDRLRKVMATGIMTKMVIIKLQGMEASMFEAFIIGFVFWTLPAVLAWAWRLLHQPQPH